MADKVIDYSKWDNIDADNDVHIAVETPFQSQIPSVDTTNLTADDAARVKIPRSPRPLPAEAPVLASDGLLEAPPPNAPKGAAAVRHYQIGFGHTIIPTKKQSSQKHRKAASMSVFDEMQKFLNEQTESQSQSKDQKKYGIQIEDDNTDDNASLLKECGELLNFMINDAKNEEQPQPHTREDNDGNHDNDDDDGFNASHHDYFRHNPYEYYRQKAMQTHQGHDAVLTTDAAVPKIDVVVKLGGAFITDKKTLHTLRADQIEIAAQQIADAFAANYMMVLIHGAGSFGHFEAKKYKLMNGLYGDDSAQGMVLCRAAVSILHQHVMAKLMEHRVPVMSVSPNAIVTSTDGVVSRRQLRPFLMHIKRIMKHGMIPLIHGDVIFDDKRGCHIWSGDAILETLCSAFSPQRAVFWSNMEGVYDCTDQQRPPTLLTHINVNPRGIPELDVNVVKQLKNPSKFKSQQQDAYMQALSKKMDEKQKGGKGVQTPEHEESQQNVTHVDVDVTGGMWGKILVSAKCAAQGIDVVMTKGGTEDAKLALLGKYAKNSTVFVQSDTTCDVSSTINL